MQYLNKQYCNYFSFLFMGNVSISRYEISRYLELYYQVLYYIQYRSNLTKQKYDTKLMSYKKPIPVLPETNGHSLNCKKAGTLGN